jgi:hypothetical protein
MKPDCIFLGIMAIGKKEPTGSSPVMAPIAFAGTNALAEVDTGAQCSVVSTAIAKALKLKVTAVKGKLRGISQEFVRERIGIVEEQVGNIVIKHTFEVVEISETTSQILLGRDLLNSVGIVLQGVPVCYPEDTTPEEPFDWLEEDDYVARPEDVERDRWARQQLAKEIAENMAIPEDARCNLPDAVIKLEVYKPSKTCFVRQYSLPERMSPAIREQHAGWLAKDGSNRHRQGVKTTIPFLRSRRRMPMESSRKCVWSPTSEC